MKDEITLIAGAVAAACIALTGAAVVPHPYDKWVIGIGAVCGAIAAYLMKSPRQRKEES